jgi:hypothetical protein
MIKNKKIQKKKYGFEPGFQIVNYKTREVLHDLISGTALSKKYNKPAKEIKEPEPINKEEINDEINEEVIEEPEQINEEINEEEIKKVVENINPKTFVKNRRSIRLNEICH